MCYVHRSDVERHCRQSHPNLPGRRTGSTSAGDVDQSTRSTLNSDRLNSGVTLRQTKISECIGTARQRPAPASDTDDDDDDDDDDSDTEVDMTGIFLTICPTQRPQNTVTRRPIPFFKELYVNASTDTCKL